MTTLESMRDQHDKATAPTTKAKTRQRARTLATALGVAVPDWAAKQEPAAAKREPALPVVTEPPPEVPPALSAWRSAGPGRVVNVRRDGSVRLVVLGFGGAHQEAAFTDARTAEQALLLGVTWRRREPPATSEPGARRDNRRLA